MPARWLNELPESARGAQATAWLAAFVLPWLIGLSFSHPTPGVVVPESLMLLVVVMVTFAGGALPGVAAAANSMLSLWVCSLPPGLTLRLSSAYDVFAVIACGVVATVIALTVTWLRALERAASVRTEAVELARHDDLQLITELQRAILPAAPANVDGVSFDCAYRAGGGAGNGVGGDWYAFIPLEDGRVGIAIGDVVGHGVRAISAMAEYRFTLRTLAASGEPPEVVLNQLELLSRRLRRIDAFTTCVYGIIDPAAGSWTFANAGQLPPLLVRDGVAAVLDRPTGPPIGAFARTPCYKSYTTPMRAGDSILLYTDGIVERRGEPLDVGIQRLCRRAASIAGPLDSHAATVIDEMVGAEPRDDSALVIVRLDHTVVREPV